MSLKVVVLSGAGISADSGIPTYRSSDGLWANYKIEEVCTPEALARDNTEEGFAEPRIYLSDQQDIRAFQQFIDTVGSNMTSVKIGSVDAAVPRYGEKAQFVVQKDITLPDDYIAPTTFKGIIHGNGHVISGLSEKASFISDNQGQIYNLGLASGKIAENNTNGGKYH